MTAVALRYMHYNFVRIHQTLRVTPATAAGITGKLWPIHDVVRTESATLTLAAWISSSHPICHTESRSGKFARIP
jgi:hypothetical protein